MLSTFDIKNGIKCATYHLPQLQSAYLSAMVKCGAIVEEPKEAGMAHYLEHVLLEGIPSYPTAESLTNYIEELAGRFNANTSYFRVNVWFTLPAKNIEDGIKMLAESLFSPLLLDKAIDKERSAIFHEIQSARDSENYRFWDFFRKIRYSRDNSLNLPILGSEKTVGTFTRSDLMKFWKKHFTGSNTTLTVVGNLPPNTKELIEKYFGVAPKGSSVQFPIFSNASFSKKTVAMDFVASMQLNKLSLNFLTDIGLNSDRIVAGNQAVIGRILFGSLTSRLYKKLRTELGLVYSVSGGHVYWLGKGMVEINSQVSNENLIPVLKIIAEEIKSLMTLGPTQEELNQAVNYKINSSLMSFDSPGAISEWVEGELLWEESVALPQELIKTLKAITVSDLIAHMKKHWDLDQINLIVQGPMKKNQASKQAIAKIIDTL